MITWAGRLIVFYGAAHTIGALTVEGAASHYKEWFSRDLAGESFSDMSPALSAYWFSINSFGPPLVLLGLMVLWLSRRGITPPAFPGWAMIGWVVLGTVIAGPGVGQDAILLVGAILLLVGIRRANDADPSAVPDAQSWRDNRV